MITCSESFGRDAKAKITSCTCDLELCQAFSSIWQLVLTRTRSADILKYSCLCVRDYGNISEWW